MKNSRSVEFVGSPASEQSAHYATDQSTWTAATAVMMRTTAAMATGRMVAIDFVAGACGRRRDGFGQAIAGPVKWDVKFIERFMLVFGPVSSVFDFITFYVLLYLFGAGEALFQTGWFIESITTQVLVVFAIRTRRPIFRSKPHVFLAAMAIAVVAVAIALPMLPVGRWLGFVAPPPLFFVFLIGATLAYLAIVEIAKRIFYRVMSVAKH